MTNEHTPFIVSVFTNIFVWISGEFYTIIYVETYMAIKQIGIL